MKSGQPAEKFLDFSGIPLAIIADTGYISNMRNTFTTTANGTKTMSLKSQALARQQKIAEFNEAEIANEIAAIRKEMAKINRMIDRATDPVNKAVRTINRWIDLNNYNGFDDDAQKREMATAALNAWNGLTDLERLSIRSTKRILNELVKWSSDPFAYAIPRDRVTDAHILRR